MPNVYPEKFLELLAETDGRVLDCGAGGRAHERIVALEIVEHPANTVQADGLALPFRDATFELVLSQAVLEHVHDPQRYVDEIVRVLAPGGRLYIEAAFLQPVHQAPEHYFNVTPFGLAYLCRALDIIETGAIGLLVEQWAWILAEAGAHTALNVDQHAELLALLRLVDAAISPTQLHNIASGVSLLGRKPA